MGTGRNGESNKNNTADRMTIVVNKPVKTGYLKKKLASLSPHLWKFRFFKDLTIIDLKSKLHTVPVL